MRAEVEVHTVAGVPLDPTRSLVEENETRFPTTVMDTPLVPGVFDGAVEEI